MNLEHKRLFVTVILIAILGFAVYGNSLKGEFLWDDIYLVKDNASIKDFSSIPTIFAKDEWRFIAERKFNLYRPLQTLTYMVDYSLWKLNVMGYHLTNILLHILTALAVFWLVNILFDDRLLSLITGTLFVVHPVHTESVTYISGRADPLAAVFMLLCFILYIKHICSNNTKIYILALLTYALALLSRENSLVLPVLLLLYHYAFKKKIKAKEFLPISGLAFIYILLRIAVLGYSPSDIMCATSVFQRIPGFFAAITNYVKLLFLPFGLHMEYGNKLFGIADPRAVLGIVILPSLLLYAFRKRNKNGLIFFSISWFFIALLPQSNLFPINAYMAEHWLYLPSIGFFLILAKGLSSIYKAKNLRIFAIVLIIGIVTFYSYLTIRQNTYWKEPITLYERTLRYAPASVRATNNLGLRYYEMGKRVEAITLYKKTIETDPNYTNAHYNLGNVYYDIGRNEKAIASYKKAIEINPTYARAYNNLGVVYYDMGYSEEAISLYKKTIEIDPDCEDAYYNLGNAYYNIGDNKRAATLYKKAIEADPAHAEAYNNLGVIYYNLGNNKEAVSLFKKAIEINPDYTDAQNNLALEPHRR